MIFFLRRLGWARALLFVVLVACMVVTFKVGTSGLHWADTSRVGSARSSTGRVLVMSPLATIVWLVIEMVLVLAVLRLRRDRGSSSRGR